MSTEESSANSSNKETYREDSDGRSRAVGLVQVGLIAAASAVMGGVAAAWWHRKTLAKLQNPIIVPDIQNSIFSGEDDEEQTLPVPAAKTKAG